MPRGGTLKSPSSGQFSLHAKAFVFDRKRIFIGSANFDARSLHLNTEIGLMIESPELARQVVARFEAIASPRTASCSRSRRMRNGRVSSSGRA